MNDKYTDQILKLFGQASDKTQAKMLAAVIALTEGTEEEQQILRDFVKGKKEGMQRIYDKYMPRVMALLQKEHVAGASNSLQTERGDTYS